MRTRYVTRQLGILAALGLLGFALVYPHTYEPPPYAAIARVLGPYLKNSAPAYPSYVAGSCDLLRAYTEHSGLCFEQLGHQSVAARDDTRLRAFVFGPQPATASEQALLSWAQEHTTDVTDALIRELGSDPGYRVMVR